MASRIHRKVYVRFRGGEKLEIISKIYLYLLIEKGERKVTINILYLLAQIYNCNMEDLLKQAN